MRKARKYYSPSEKVAILRLRLVDRVPARELCNEHRLRPTVFYHWRRDLFERGAAAFDRSGELAADEDERRIAALQATLERQSDMLIQLMKEHVQLKKRIWGPLTGAWVAREKRDAVVDHVRRWSEITGISSRELIAFVGITESKFHSWKKRYGKDNAHNAVAARGWWLEDWEKQAIIEFHSRFPLENYRTLAFMMLDANIVAVSPSSVFRVLRDARLIRKIARNPSLKGKGFRKSRLPHDCWDFEVSRFHTGGKSFYFVSVVDCYSRFMVHWELQESLTRDDTGAIVRRACERYPDKRPELIANTAPTVIAKELQQFLEFGGMTDLKTSADGAEREEKIAPSGRSRQTGDMERGEPSSPDGIERMVEAFIRHYNEVRPQAALGYVTPADKLAGRDRAILAERPSKLEIARLRRQEGWSRVINCRSSE